jgi:hypothetical protein
MRITCSYFWTIVLVRSTNISHIRIFPFTVPLGPLTEFLITELALASHSIPSLTLASPSLLYSVLESHPPTAIVVEGNFLPDLLELIFKRHELANHFIIVVGEVDQKVLSEVPKQTRLAFWDHIEAQGKAGTTISSPAPRKSLSYFVQTSLAHTSSPRSE